MKRLLLFDCDGTLVDSERLIEASMVAAFARVGRPALVPGSVRTVVGLSLHVAVARLAPDAADDEIEVLCGHYREAFAELRETDRYPEVMFPGAREALERLREAGWLLGVATGKSRRGLDSVLRAHHLAGLFDTLQTADQGPGKPDPAMVLRALEETGVDPARTVVIGDTTYDVLMALAAGVGAIGVSWGYHPARELGEAGAHVVIDAFEELDGQAEALAGR